MTTENLKKGNEISEEIKIIKNKIQAVKTTLRPPSNSVNQPKCYLTLEALIKITDDFIIKGESEPHFHFENEKIQLNFRKSKDELNSFDRHVEDLLNAYLDSLEKKLESLNKVFNNL